jgi:glyoxylase-like metal-dependent hydrolase (beta-lactamase superfamily II)
MPNDGLRAVNVYAIDGGAEGGCVLIDGGWALAEAQQALEAALDGIGYALSDIRRILVTHAHRDHYTLGVTLQRTLGTRLAIGIGERENVEVAMRDANSSSARVLPNLGAAHLSDVWDSLFTPEERARTAAAFGLPDEWLADGQVLDAGTRTLTAIQTPGHTRGHLVYLDPSASVLFTGDHVLPHITPSIGFESARVDNPLGDYLRSLHLLLTHPDAVMLPAHGSPADSVHKRVHELIAHHDQRLADTLAAARAGAGTAYGAARRLGWTRRNTPFEELTLFNQILAIGETNAHLVVLTERGQLTRSVDGDGLITYEPVRP